MEKINTEMVIASLFNAGFEEVDSVLFTCTLGKIAIDNAGKYIFNNQEISQTFNDYVDFNGTTYKLKEGFDINMNISKNNNYSKLLSEKLISSKSLIEYFNNIDFNDIVLRKVQLYGVENISDETFCKKELSILKEIDTKKNIIK